MWSDTDSEAILAVVDPDTDELSDRVSMLASFSLTRTIGTS